MHGCFRKQSLPSTLHAIIRTWGIFLSWEGVLPFMFCFCLTQTVACLPFPPEQHLQCGLNNVTWSLMLTGCQKILEKLLIGFYRETWPTQIQRLKQYFEVNETAQEKRIIVQQHFTGGNTQFAGCFEGFPGPCLHKICTNHNVFYKLQPLVIDEQFRK